MGILEILMIMGLIVGINGFFKSRADRKRTSGTALLLRQSEGFVPAITNIMCKGQWGIALDVQNNRIAIAEAGVCRVYNFDQIISVEARQDGKPVGRGTQDALLGAVVGGAVLGGVGALMGVGMSRSMQTLSLRLLTNDLSRPWVEVFFLNERIRRFPRDKRVRAAMPLWEDWYGRITTIVVRQPTIIAEERPVHTYVA